MDTRVDLYSLLMTTNAKFNKRLFSALHKSGLSHGQPKVLDYLGSHDGSPQKDIAIGCMIEPATVTSLISKMVSDGLVERRHLDSDRRTSYVYLTEKGHIMQKSKGKANAISRHTKKLPYSVPRDILQTTKITLAA